MYVKSRKKMHISNEKLDPPVFGPQKRTKETITSPIRLEHCLRRTLELNQRPTTVLVSFSWPHPQLEEGGDP